MSPDTIQHRPASPTPPSDLQTPADDTPRPTHTTSPHTDEDKLRPHETQESGSPRPPVVPTVTTDDAAVQNIELRDTVRRMEEESRAQAETIRVLTDSLHRLSRDMRSQATSPTTPGESRVTCGVCC